MKSWELKYLAWGHFISGISESTLNLKAEGKAGTVSLSGQSQPVGFSCLDWLVRFTNCGEGTLSARAVSA